MALTQITTKGIKDGTILGADLTTNVDLVDNQKIRFGTGNDLQIYHDGSDSYIKNTGTGNLRIASSDFIVLNGLESQFIIRGLSGGTTELYHAGDKKLETESSGCKIDGSLELTANLVMSDNDKIRLGNSQDLEIYHDGSDSYLKDVGTGHLNITSSQVNIINAAVNESMAKFIQDGAVELYHDGSKKFETVSFGAVITGKLAFNNTGTNLHLADNQIAAFGTSQDLQIFHNGSNSFIKHNGTGALWVYADDFNIGSPDGTQKYFNAVKSGAVELYHNNSKKFQTTSGGISVSGDISVEDNSFIRVRTTGDNTSTAIQLGHDGTATFSGNVGIGTTSPSAALHIVSGGANLKLSRSSFDDFQIGIGTVGSVNGLHINNQTDNSTAFSISEDGHIFAPNLNSGNGHSDLRYLTSTGQIFFDSSTRLVKTDIQDCSYGLAQIQQLKPRIYKRTDADNAVEIGLIADEVQGVLPEIVATEQKSFFTKNESDTEIIPSNVDLKRLTVVLIKGIQELAAEVAALKAA